MFNSAISTEQLSTLISQIKEHIRQQYVLPQYIPAYLDALSELLEKGTPNHLNDLNSLIEAINDALQSAHKDAHLRLRLAPAYFTAELGVEDMQKRHFEQLRRANYGFERLERLTGNVGYLNLRELPPLELAQDLLEAALKLMANAPAIILDLRRNEGGSPDMVAALISAFFDTQPRALSGIYWRPLDQTEESSTRADIPTTRLNTQLLVVLISRQTFSAAEAVAYDLQVLNRATLIGEPTRGGAHPVAMENLSSGLILDLPIGRAINPITGENWEVNGVRPDIAVPADRALERAQTFLLERLIDSAANDEDRAYYEWELTSLRIRKRPHDISPMLMAQYGGTYGSYDVLLGDGGLYADYQGRNRLLPIDDSNFLLDDSTRLRFERNDQGQVYALTELKRDGSQRMLQRE